MIRAARMRSARTLLSLLFATAVAASCGGPGGSFDCAAVCGQLKSCVDTTLDLQLYSDRCYDRVDDDAELRANFDNCSNCLDMGHACADVPTKCGACATLASELSRARH
jgi:hypothetical protein